MAPTENEIPNGDKPASELTKREWFAGMIISGVVQNRTGLSRGVLVQVAELADAILDALENTKEPA